MLVTCWYLCFPVSRALWFAILCRCLASHRSASSPLTLWFLHSCSASALFFRSCLLLRWSSPQSAIFGISLAARAVVRYRDIYTDALLTLLRSYIYIYIYIQTLAQNRTAVIKMSCSLRSATMVCNHVPKAGGYYCSGVCLYKCTSCWTTYGMYH